MATTGRRGWWVDKRHLLVDSNELVLAVWVDSADMPDRDGGRQLLDEGKSC